MFTSPADIARQAERVAEESPDEGSGEEKKGVKWAPELECASVRGEPTEVRERRRGGEDEGRMVSVQEGTGTNSRKGRKMPSADAPLVRILLHEEQVPSCVQLSC